VVITFDPIILRYQGLEAEKNLIDLGQLGRSLQGASRLLGAAANIVATEEYVKRSPALSVRVLAGIPQPNSYDVPAIIVTVAPALIPVFPFLQETVKKGSNQGNGSHRELRDIKSCREKI
jgi:hypothetical protein